MAQDARPIAVLMAPGPVAGERTATVTQLVDWLGDDVAVTDFSWPRAFFGRFDIVHVHWPEHLVGTDGRAFGRAVALATWTWWSRLRRMRLVWTVHNDVPHETPSRATSWALRMWDARVDARVFMYHSALPDKPRPGDVVIRRGDYRDVVRALAPIKAAAGPPRERNIATVGLLRRYKGIEELIAAYKDLEHGGRPVLRISGEPFDNDYATELERLVSGDPDIEMDFRRLGDAEFIEALEAAHVVVLPYERAYNSGVALFALSVNRPVLVRDSPTMRELQHEVGQEWVVLFDTLDAQTLTRALNGARELDPASAPNLELRDWTHIGRQHVELYRRLSKRDPAPATA